MQRRQFLAGLTLLPALPIMAYADDSKLSIGIYPGTGKADVFMDDFREAAMPFALALAASLDRKPGLTLFRPLSKDFRVFRMVRNKVSPGLRSSEAASASAKGIAASRKSSIKTSALPVPG